VVKLHPVLNGIDYLEVLDDLSDPYNERQTTLFVHFLKPLSPGQLNAGNVKIEGGVRIKNIQVIEAAPGTDDTIPASPPAPEDTGVLVVKVSRAGDFSTYTLRLIDDENEGSPPEDFDPVLSSVDFSFKAGCNSDFDCKTADYCGDEPVKSPNINYLNKDYAGFRQLMLDRMSLLMPEWKERNPSDLGITLVELLSYSADYLSYRQDAIATEAYLDTSRKRISVRRHARLVDYFMHDGCNARTWLHLNVGENINGVHLPKGNGAGTTRVLARQDGLPAVFKIDSKEFKSAIDNGAKVFELMHDIDLFTAHNEMKFYTWIGEQCCLPRGATSATLTGDLSTLKPGDVLILCEVLGPETGVAEDADPKHRHAVRLTEITLSHDILNESAGSPPESTSFPVTEIKWDFSDALPFPLCISSQDGTENISVALGNNVLVDHGLTIDDGETSSLSPSVVPGPAMQYVKSKVDEGCDVCETSEAEAVPARFNPGLNANPLTHYAPLDPGNIKLSARSIMNWSMRDTMPAIFLTGKSQGSGNAVSQKWSPRRDLLNSASNANEFVVETESDGTVYLRFGNGKQGERPAAGTAFFATYRIGNGLSGNVGRESLTHLATNDATAIGALSDGTAVWNPLPATGGAEPESADVVRQLAPNAFRKQQRAVIPDDYEEFSKKERPDIQHVATTLRWTGSWRTVFLTADRFGGLEVNPEFEKDLRSKLERYRLAGFDLEVDSPLEVALELEIDVCVKDSFFASDVRAALLELFSSHVLPDGRKGIFHPDNFSFGQPVYLSRIYAAAQSIQGVGSLKITKFSRRGDNSTDDIDTGKLILERREIAMLDNDPNFPERGVIKLTMNGGRLK
jgi:hypothetical protein